MKNKERTDAQWALDLLLEKVEESPNTSGSVLVITIGYERVQRLLRGLENARKTLERETEGEVDIRKRMDADAVTRWLGPDHA